jgi:hypothetical protein
MAESKTAKKNTQRSAKSTASANTKFKGFSDEERAAMRERAQELKAEAHANRDKADGERDVLAKIAEMPEPDRAMAERLHAIIKASAPRPGRCRGSRHRPSHGAVVAGGGGPVAPAAAQRRRGRQHRPELPARPAAGPRCRPAGGACGR